MIQLAHHQVSGQLGDAATASSRWTSGFGLAALVVLLVAVVAAGLWVVGPRRWRTSHLLRVAVAGLIGASALAACSSGGDTVSSSGDSGEPSLLFTSAGGDPLADVVNAEGAAPGTGAGLPDLVGFTGRNFSTEEVTYADTTMLVQRFDGIVGNVGPGPLDIFGNPALSNPNDPTSHDVWQRTWDGAAWTNVTKPPIRFEAADNHNHFHLMQLARYGLHNLDMDVEVAPAHKVGFCFLDSQPLGFWSAGADLPGAAQINDGSPRPYASSTRDDSFCRAGSPHAEALHMGISPGWGDLYAQSLTLQWFDVSDVVPGVYVMSSTMDPNDVIVEADETNNGPVFSAEKITVRGYRAAPVRVDTTGPTPVTLDAVSAGGGLTPPTFTLVSSPANGTIDVGVGQPLAGSTFNYTPNAGFVGVEIIDFIATLDGSAYPHNPVRAQAVIVVGEQAEQPLVISGFRSPIASGSAVELDAFGPAGLDDSTVTWSVNGIVGGDASVGTISPNGWFQAPDGVGEVVISASTPEGVAAQITIEIAPAPNHAPWIGTPVTYQGDGDPIPSDDPTDNARELSTLKVGEHTAILIPAVDLNGDLLTLTATNVPPGMSFNVASGALTGAPTQSGDYDVTITASDGTQQTTATFVLDVDG